MRRPLALLLLVATPAFAADQFDMACQGTKLTTRAGPAEPATVRVHVDLAARQWCLDACGRVQPIQDVSDAAITFKDDTTLNTREESTTEVTVDRRTNRFHQLLIFERPQTSYLKLEATCTIEAFTPFPAGKAPPRS